MNCESKSSFINYSFRFSFILLFIQICNRIWTNRIYIIFIRDFISRKTQIPTLKGDRNLKGIYNKFCALFHFTGVPFLFLRGINSGRVGWHEKFHGLLFLRRLLFKGFFRNCYGLFLQPLLLLSVHASIFLSTGKKTILM